MSAEEAIARAKAIAARLAGSGAVASTAPETPSSMIPPPATSVAVSNNDVTSVADAALAAAFGDGSGGTGDSSTLGSGSKRKRWGADSGAGKI